MAGPVTGVRIRGAAELERAFLEVRREVLRELRPAIRKAAEPMRRDAESRALDQIPNIGPRWYKMRIGMSLRAGVYMVPRSHRAGGSPRQNLNSLLMDRAMEPAFNEHEAEVIDGIEQVVTFAGLRNGFTVI